jgi:2-polyprenyl-3-methyl-5-hydroxy-6-metoxy-1,4-benzoquinol methylase
VMQKVGRVTGETFSVVRCLSCEHIYIEPRIADDELSNLYNDAYYSGNGFDETIDYEAPPSQWTIAENALIVASVYDALKGQIQGARWLDVGCGSGTLLEAICKSGASGFGFDESAAAERTCESRGLHLLSKADLDSQRGTFDVVSAVQVIEHVPDPADFLTYLASLVRDSGIIFVHTENWNVVRRLPGTPYVMPEGHIQYFTPASMRKLFTSCGIEEVPVFNRVWFLWRRLPNSLRRLVPTTMLTLLQRLLVSVASGYAPFPIGRKPSP